MILLPIIILVAVVAAAVTATAVTRNTSKNGTTTRRPIGWPTIATALGALLLLVGIGLYVGGIASEPDIYNDHLTETTFTTDPDTGFPIGETKEGSFIEKARLSKNLKTAGFATGGAGLVILIVGLSTRRPSKESATPVPAS